MRMWGFSSADNMLLVAPVRAVQVFHHIELPTGTEAILMTTLVPKLSCPRCNSQCLMVLTHVFGRTSVRITSKYLISQRPCGPLLQLSTWRTNLPSG